MGSLSCPTGVPNAAIFSCLLLKSRFVISRSDVAFSLDTVFAIYFNAVTKLPDFSAFIFAFKAADLLSKTNCFIFLVAGFVNSSFRD